MGLTRECVNDLSEGCGSIWLMVSSCEMVQMGVVRR